MNLQQRKTVVRTVTVVSRSRSLELRGSLCRLASEYPVRMSDLLEGIKNLGSMSYPALYLKTKGEISESLGF